MSEPSTATTSVYLTPAQAARIAPGNPGPATVWRWMTKGVKAPNGERVYLKHLRMGGKLLTTEAWLLAFGEELAGKGIERPEPAETPAEPAPRPASSAIRERQIREAKERLGIT